MQNLQETGGQNREINVFVGRDAELAEFNTILTALVSNGKWLPEAKIVEYYGAPGIGKSALIRQEMKTCREQGVTAAYFDFSQHPEKIQEYREDPVRLLTDIVAELRRQPNGTRYNWTEFNRARQKYLDTMMPDEGVVAAYDKMDQETRLYKRPPWLEAKRTVIIEFIRLINLSETPTVLFFDNTRNLPTQLIDWVEEWIVNPVIQIPHAEIVWAAARPWRWKRPEIRRTLLSHELPTLSLEDTLLQAKNEVHSQKQLETGAGLIHTLTGGLPEANHVAFQTLNNLMDKGIELTNINEPTIRRIFAETVFRAVIEKHAFASLSEQMRTVFTLIALTRSFDSTMLQSVLQAADPERFISWQPEQFREYVNQMKITGLLEWDKGLAVNKNLRHLIHKYLLITNPQAFVAGNRAAQDVYSHWLDLNIDSRILFIEELLWHSALLKVVGQSVNLPTILQTQLQLLQKFIPDGPNDENYDTALSKIGTAMERVQNDIKQFMPDTNLHGLPEQVAQLRK